MNVQCDIDGVVCDTRRFQPDLASLQITPEQMWQETADTPEPVTPVIDWLWQATRAGWGITYVTGRRSTQASLRTLTAVGAPPGGLLTPGENVSPADHKLDCALRLRPTVVLEDDPTICTLLRRCLHPSQRIVRIPGWLFEERAQPITPTLPLIGDPA